MLCIDTSSFISYLEGESGADVDLIDRAFTDKVGMIAPVTLTEMLSDPQLNKAAQDAILQLPLLPVLDGYWERAGRLRAKMLRQGCKAKLADTLIAQSCLDHDATLVARDRDFKAFARVAGLELLSD